MLTESQLFQPADPLDLTKGSLFVGRENLLEDCIRVLSEDNSFCVLYGDLAIGKSSLAWRLFEQFERPNSNFSFFELIGSSQGKGKYIPLWLSCRNQLNLDTVLLSLLDESGQDRNRTLLDVYPDLLKPEERTSVKDSLKIATGFLTYEAKFEGAEGEDRLLDSIKEVRASITETASSVFSKVVKRALESDPERRELVIFFDDFEKIRIKEEISSFLLSLNGVRFVLVGIAELPSELVDQNESIERHLTNRQFRVDPLTDVEVAEIFSRAEALAASDKDLYNLRFDSKFVQAVWEISLGQPLVAQYYGYNVCVKRRVLSRLSKAPVTVGFEDIEFVERNFFSEEEDSPLPGAIKRIKEGIGSGVNRPRITRRAARRFGGWFTLAKLRSILDENQRRGLEDHLDRLVDHKVLIRSSTNSDRYQFSTPTMRMLCRRIPIDDLDSA